MKALIQRVKQCRVTVDEKIVGEIKNGLLVLLGVSINDTEENADYLVNKIIHLRIFEDGQGKMNQSLLEKGYSILVVSQFTLYADCKKGRRPSFTRAAKPDLARKLYDYFKQKLVDAGIHTESGEFQAMMDVSLVNSGPVTIMIESKS